MSDNLGELSVTINGRDVGLSRLLRQVERELRASDAAAQRSTNETLQLSSAYGRLASALGQPAAGAAQLRSTLEGLTNVETRQAVAIQTQIARLDQQAAKLRDVGTAATGSTGGLTRLTSAASGINTILGAAGFAVGAQQIVQFTADAVQSAISLDRVQSSLRTLAGSQAAYANVVALAREQQALFGGTLEDNLADLTSFTVLARSSGAELGSLVDLAQRLATFDPGQGLRGASAALRELLAGNPNALAARFELPKAALVAIKDESATTTDRLRVLNDVLNQAGITSELVAGSVSAEARAINEFNAALDNAKVSFGSFLASGLGGLVSLGKNQTALNAQILSGAGSYAAYQTAIAATNTQITSQSTLVTGLVARLPQLTEQQFQLAQALAQQGTSAQDAVAAVQQYGAQISQLNTGQQALLASLVQQGQSLQQALSVVGPLGQQLGTVASAQQQLVASGDASAASAARLAQQLSALIAIGGPVGATAAALADSYVTGSIGADQLTAALARLEEAQSRVVSITSANGAAIAAMDGATRDATTAVTAENAAIGEQLVATQQAEARTRALAEANQVIASLGGQVAAGLTTIGAAASVLAAQYGIAEAAARSLIAAQAQIATQGRFQALREERDARLSGAGPQTASKSALAFVAQAEEAARKAQEARARAARAGSRGGGGGGADPLKAQADIERRSVEQERDYQDRRTEIAREGAERRAEAEREFAQQQRSDRASFYERLADIDDNGVRQGLSARFEAANAEAARIAQEQGADAAAAYLDAAQQAIESEAQLEQKIRDAQASGDTATAEFLQGVLKLRQEANNAELQAIKDKGSAIAAEEARQYAESERQYAEHLDRLAGIAAQKGVTLGQTLPPATVAGGAGTTPGRPTTTIPAVPPTTTPTTTGRAQPVEDIATPGAIDTQTARLEGRLSALLGAVEQVAREVASVRGAIEGLKRSPAFTGA